MKFPKLVRARKVRPTDTIHPKKHGAVRITFSEEISDAFTRLIGVRVVDGEIVRMIVPSKRRMFVVKEDGNAPTARIERQAGPAAQQVPGLRGGTVPLRHVPDMPGLRRERDVRDVPRVPGGGPASTAPVRVVVRDRPASAVATTDIPTLTGFFAYADAGARLGREEHVSPVSPESDEERRVGPEEGQPRHLLRERPEESTGEFRVVPGMREAFPRTEGAPFHDDRASAGLGSSVTAAGILRRLHALNL